MCSNNIHYSARCPTLTHALLSGSPAIDAGDNASCPATDQRGVNKSDGACDIGAYEYPWFENTGVHRAL